MDPSPAEGRSLQTGDPDESKPGAKKYSCQVFLEFECAALSESEARTEAVLQAMSMLEEEGAEKFVKIVSSDGPPFFYGDGFGSILSDQTDRPN